MANICSIFLTLQVAVGVECDHDTIKRKAVAVDELPLSSGLLTTFRAMINSSEYQRVIRALPMLHSADSSLTREFRQKAFLARIPAGRDVFVEGAPAETIALLLSGTVRVYKIGETGREITLYRFGHGESCVLTANAILSQQSFPAIATVERDAEAVVVLATDFRDWVNRFDVWRSFVFDLLSQRLAGVLEIVEEVVFRRMDARLASFLLNRARSQNPISITHQEIAAELGTAREVISRILEDFSAQDLIETRRGSIEVIDHTSLHDRSLM